MLTITVDVRKNQLAKMAMGEVWKVFKVIIFESAVYAYSEVAGLEVDAGADEIKPCAGLEIRIREYYVGKGGPRKDRLFEYISFRELKMLHMEFANWVFEADRKKPASVKGGIQITGNVKSLQIWKGYWVSTNRLRYVLVDVEVLSQIEQGN